MLQLVIIQHIACALNLVKHDVESLEGFGMDTNKPVYRRTLRKAALDPGCLLGSHGGQATSTNGIGSLERL